MAKQKKQIKTIGVMTGGGDCPGLNAVIRAAAKKLIVEQQAEVIGIKDGYEGLIHGRYKRLTYKDVSGILTLGGTILGTSNIGNPYRYAVKKGRKIQFKDVFPQVMRNVKRLKVNCIVCIGGDGTLNIASRPNLATVESWCTHQLPGRCTACFPNPLKSKCFTAMLEISGVSWKTSRCPTW